MESALDIEFSSVAIVVSHPAHLLTVAGLIQRCRPKILACSGSDSSDAGKQAKIMQAGLEQIGCLAPPSFFDIDDHEAYKWVHAGDWVPFFQIRERILQWIREASPDVVLGDAFECSNYMHDVIRALLDSALREYRNDHPTVRNFEFPLACRTVEEPSRLRFQFFPSGVVEEFALTEAEVARKQALALWALPQSEFIREIAPQFPPINIEPLRAIPWNRDYSKVPEGVEKHYDRRGLELVEKGLYSSPILFEKHFIPLIRELGLGA